LKKPLTMHIHFVQLLVKFSLEVVRAFHSIAVFNLNVDEHLLLLLMYVLK
jgi:hypothetical protein